MRLFVFSAVVCAVVAALCGAFAKADYLLSRVAGAPVAADVIVVLGSPERIAKAGELYQGNYSTHIFLTIPDYVHHFDKQGTRPADITVPKWRPQTTYQEALAFAEYLQKHPVKSAILVTDPYHQYRAKWTFEHVLADSGLKFSYIATNESRPSGFWWHDVNSRLFILTEIPKVFYYWIYHGLLGREADPPWTEDLKRWYHHFIGVRLAR